MGDEDELCIHEMTPGQCSICLHRDDKAVKRAASTVTKHRDLVCPVCERSLAEAKFPTDKNQVRRTDTCRECEKDVAAKVKAGATRDEALERRRRQFRR